MVTKVFKGIIILNWKNGKIDIVKRKNKPLIPSEIAINFKIDVNTPEQKEYNFKGSVDIPEAKYSEMVINEL